MKRLCIQALVLCAMLMTVTVTASAVGGTVSNLTIQQDANITIQPLTDAGTAITPTDGTYKEVSKFQITLNQTKQGGTYLLMVLSGDGLPTKDTLYWANILPGNGGKLDVKVNAKKSMGDGTYKVFLSSGETDKASLALLDYQATNPIKPGLVVNQNAAKPTVQDALYALYIAVGKTVDNVPWTAEQKEAANVDGDAQNQVTVRDALWILERAVGKRNENWELVG